MALFETLKQNSERNQRRRRIEELVKQLIENEEADGKCFPEEAENRKAFVAVLKKALEGCVKREGPVDATVKFHITEDRMTAYACLLPELWGGEKLTPGKYAEVLHESGITYGINDELALSYLAKRYYMHIFPIAKGTPKKDGEDGKTEELFEPLPVFRIEGHDGKPVDFSIMRPVQLIKRGEPVRRISRATKGTEGTDVTGRKLECKDGVEAEAVPGHNMQLAEDGLSIEASENGGVFLKDGEMYIQTAIVRRGGIKKNDELVWLAYVDGDICEGVKVESTSNIVVMGEIRGAEIHSKGSVRAQGGIRNGAHIEAHRQVLAPVIEDSVIKAGADIYAEEIYGSDVSSKGSIFVTGGKGTIRKSTVRAIEHIECNEIGDDSGENNEIVLGFYQELKDEIKQLSEEFDEVQGTLDKLRKNILKLRMGGGSLSLENRKLLSKLIEQKELYESRAADINLQLKEAKEKRRSGLESDLTCQKLNPPATVQIGEHKSSFAFPQSRCRFRLYAGSVITSAIPNKQH